MAVTRMVRERLLVFEFSLLFSYITLGRQPQILSWGLFNLRLSKLWNSGEYMLVCKPPILWHFTRVPCAGSCSILQKPQRPSTF